MLADCPSVWGVALNLNRLICIRIEGHVEMNLSAADRDNGVVVEIVHEVKYTGNVRLCPVECGIIGGDF